LFKLVFTAPIAFFGCVAFHKAFDDGVCSNIYITANAVIDVS
jgi:hypothetical protein